jgi:thiol-disulfide isomerase/thioredoxin
MSIAAGVGALALGVMLAGASPPSVDLPLMDRHGAARPLDGHRGRIVVIDFWATWCAPCVEALPDLAAIQRRYQDRGVDVIAVSLDEPAAWDRAAGLLGREAPGVMLRVGPAMADVLRLTGSESLPAMVVVDADGSAASRTAGPFDPEELSSLLDWLTGGRQGPRPAHAEDEPGHEHEAAGETAPSRGESLVPS